MQTCAPQSGAVSAVPFSLAVTLWVTARGEGKDNGFAGAEM
jgi:hypothetical protein